MRNLFPSDKAIGVFKSFSKGGLEFQADLILPYRNEFQYVPMHGQFLLVELETTSDAILGRITMIESQGRLNTDGGDDYALRLAEDPQGISEDVREQYLKYRTNMKVLGVIRDTEAGLAFVPSHRRLPHYGSKVTFLSDEVLRFITNHDLEGAELGFLAFGEFVFADRDPRFRPLPGMQVRAPAIIPRFEVNHLVARRSFVFARAGFGKSNLVKLLFSHLYEKTPEVEKRAGKKVPVGTVIFDPDGEYFWPDDRSRPGLCDVPDLEDKLVVFTDKQAPSHFYDSFKMGGIKLDIRTLRPSLVLSNVLSPERLEQQNVQKLMQLDNTSWQKLVDLIAEQGHHANLADLKRLLRLEGSQEVEALAARGNMNRVVSMLHDKQSRLLSELPHALRQGKICIIDISRLGGRQGLALSGIILQTIFEGNQQEFTQREPETIPVIAVLEEAQSVLQERRATHESPYISWVKEGRKYDLGAVLITQQPGSIPSEILSQGDNWFVFHLLSAGDLKAVQQANAHFSDDLLSSLLNEPIAGQGIFWSSAGGKPYPLSVRVMSFEDRYRMLDPQYQRQAAPTFARRRRQRLNTQQHIEDPLVHRQQQVIQALRQSPLHAAIQSGEGALWIHISDLITKALPSDIPLPKDEIYKLAIEALNASFGKHRWRTIPDPRNPNRKCVILAGTNQTSPSANNTIPV